MQSFFPLQACFSVLQLPLPLQSFLPLQSCFAPSAAVSIGIAGAAESAAAGASVDDAAGAAIAGSAAGGVDPPQATPAMMPVIAAVISELERFIG